MGNAIAVKGARGERKPSQQAIAGINLQKEVPDARVLYVSATGATEVSNLTYAERLGLWGEDTPFADAKDVHRPGLVRRHRRDGADGPRPQGPGRLHGPLALLRRRHLRAPGVPALAVRARGLRRAGRRLAGGPVERRRGAGADRRRPQPPGQERRHVAVLGRASALLQPGPDRASDPGRHRAHAHADRRGQRRGGADRQHQRGGPGAHRRRRDRPGHRAGGAGLHAAAAADGLRAQRLPGRRPRAGQGRQRQCALAAGQRQRGQPGLRPARRGHAGRPAGDPEPDPGPGESAGLDHQRLRRRSGRRDHRPRPALRADARRGGQPARRRGAPRQERLQGRRRGLPGRPEIGPGLLRRRRHRLLVPCRQHRREPPPAHPLHPATRMERPGRGPGLRSHPSHQPGVIAALRAADHGPGGPEALRLQHRPPARSARRPDPRAAPDDIPRAVHGRRQPGEPLCRYGPDQPVPGPAQRPHAAVVQGGDGADGPVAGR